MRHDRSIKINVNADSIAFLHAEAEREGTSIAALVRRLLAERYPKAGFVETLPAPESGHGGARRGSGRSRKAKARKVDRPTDPRSLVTARRLLSKGWKPLQVAQYTGLPYRVLEKLRGMEVTG